MTAVGGGEILVTPSIRRRLASMLYDGLLVIGVVFFGFLVPNVVLGVAANVMLPSGILLLYLVAVIGSYFVWFWRRDGRTLAMKTWKMRLVSADGSAPQMDQLVLRFLLAGIFVPSLLAIVWATFDRDRQFLHDRIAGTRLVLSS